MIGEFLTAMFSIRWNGKYFNEWNFYLDILRIQENWLGRKFNNELACVFTAHYASKNANWNQQQLTDGGVLANRNSANHPNCFLSNQTKVQILAFLQAICERNVSCPPPENILQRQRERAWSQASSCPTNRVVWVRLVRLRFGNLTHRKVPVRLCSITEPIEMFSIELDWVLVRFLSIDYAGDE